MKHATKTKFYIGLKNDSGTIEKCDVIKFLKGFVDAGTFIDGTSLWNGKREDCIVFECVELEDHLKLEDFDASVEKTRLKTVLKEKLEDRFNQDSVLVTEEDLGVQF